ncbi:MAG: 1-phosphofructokinase family hexose kinase [Defluviitaleaceae bacterium]|nr:1-phosphofructokinase family hexose kinase [Defluviitaleaceae bacterium]
MIATVTLNPCIDQTLTIESLVRGGMNRVRQVRSDMAGKGLNVSVALKNLGIESVCLGINYNDNGRLMDSFLDVAGIPRDFFYAPGEIRTNVKLREIESGTMTEINRPGHFADDACVGEIIGKLKTSGCGTAVLSGSLPQGIGPDAYARIMDSADKVRFVLDAEGEAFRRGLAAKRKPFLIKPNLYELESAFGVKFDAPDVMGTAARAAKFCKEIVSEGVRYACVSMGQMGAVIVSCDNAFYAPAQKIPVAGLQGAGDSMVAGMLYALAEEHDNPSEAHMLRCGVAAAGASVMREGTQLCEKADFLRLMDQAEIIPLNI